MVAKEENIAVARQGPEEIQACSIIIIIIK